MWHKGSQSCAERGTVLFEGSFSAAYDAVGMATTGIIMISLMPVVVNHDYDDDPKP